MMAARIGWKGFAVVAVTVGLVVFGAANAHLVYVAFDSQPDCVPHLKNAGSNGSYRAAGSSC